jgi:uncharacterized membrane protein
VTGPPSVEPASGLHRLLGVTAVGVVVGALAGRLAPLPLALLVGWDVAALTMILWVWVAVVRFSPEQTHELATREDSSRVATSLFLLTASVASLLGAGSAVAAAGDLARSDRRALLVACALAVFLSWGVVQTVFVLRYAHEYYTAPIGGISFGASNEAPDYQDFAYFAFTIGMTFQTSDATIETRRIRRTVIRHALLAYLFGAVILAVMVNVIAGLVG